MEEQNELLLNETQLKDKIYVIRGVQVMLDSDLAEIYGYTTKRLNEQVKNNIEKFDEEDLMFQLTKEEKDVILRSKKLTLENENKNLRSKFLTSSCCFCHNRLFWWNFLASRSKFLTSIDPQFLCHLAETGNPRRIFRCCF